MLQDQTIPTGALCEHGLQPQPQTAREAEGTRGELEANKGCCEYLHVLVWWGWSLPDQPGCF